MIDDITIDLWSSINFTSTKNIRKKCNLLCNNGFDKIYIKQKDIKCVFELAFAALRFSFYVFSFFFFITCFPPHKRLLFMYCTWTVAATFDQFYVNSASVHCSRTHKFHFLSIFSLKMGPTVLFTHLKFFLLQCFQFSVSAK